MITEINTIDNGSLGKTSDYYIVNGVLSLKVRILDMMAQKQAGYIQSMDRVNRMIRDRFKTKTTTFVNSIRERLLSLLPSCIMASSEESVLGDGFQFVTDLIEPLNGSQINEIQEQSAG